MATNLGKTSLKLRRRNEDPMRAFDALPAPLRFWLSAAAMPWSPASCRKIWRKAQARGEPLEAVLERLDRAEQKTLARDAVGSQIARTGPVPYPACRAASAPHSSRSRS
ncbi:MULTISPECIES: DUF6525 family protein [Roseobacteraceae]|uniref:Uncharacterized protein n=1 Tax=Pseudosulfitobacter pseudonitzschiae TaxID=1402135 RepID=A0A221K6L1_9RHOB|nr:MULTISPECIES: DUF6525 family protein [Roseobacteraceae]ASM74503.1 hypothetical protein SULPSESMR1_04807 [Pseudosulfitobacter pseudonitzschiae]